MATGDPYVTARAIVQLTRELEQSFPPPRGAPFYGLDSELPFGFDTLYRLSERGIFRKYEQVLLLESGLGGDARWLALRLGCRVIGVSTEIEPALVATALSQRVHLDEVVRFQPAALAALPFADESFTHVWAIEPAADWSDVVFREAARVLRPSGHVAFVSTVCRTDLAAKLAHAGFHDVESEDLPGAAIDSVIKIARQQASTAQGKRRSDLTEVASCRFVYGRKP